MKETSAFSINEKVKKRFKILCVEKNINMSDAVEKLMIQAIKRHEKDEDQKHLESEKKA